MPQIYTSQQFIIGIIVAILVAGGAGYLLGNRAADSSRGPVSDSLDQMGTTSEIDLVSPVVLAGKNMIAVADGARPGNAVKISKVVFERDGWAAIHEDRSGKPGSILGAKLFPSGATENSEIELLRPTATGTHYAILHADDGDRKFDYVKDAPILENGQPVFTKFQVE